MKEVGGSRDKRKQRMCQLNWDLIAEPRVSGGKKWIFHLAREMPGFSASQGHRHSELISYRTAQTSGVNPGGRAAFPSSPPLGHRGPLGGLSLTKPLGSQPGHFEQGGEATLSAPQGLLLGLSMVIGEPCLLDGSDKATWLPFRALL